MKNIMKKIYICLFEPRKMGFFFPEKIHKSIIQLFVMILIAILPFTVRYVCYDDLSASSTEIMEDYFMEEQLSSDLLIKDGKLTGTDSHLIVLNEVIVNINPTDKPTVIDSKEYTKLHIVDFKSDRIEVSYFGEVVGSKLYSEYEELEIDFNKIVNVEYLELNKFTHLVEDAFDQVHGRWVLLNVFDHLISVITTVTICAFVMGIITKIFNPKINFKFRLKGALDAQFISIVFIFLMGLYEIRFLKTLGIIFAAIYLIRALMAVVKIEVRRRSDVGGE